MFHWHCLNEWKEKKVLYKCSSFIWIGGYKEKNKRTQKPQHQRWESGVGATPGYGVRSHTTLRVCLCEMWNAWTFIKDKDTYTLRYIGYQNNC